MNSGHIEALSGHMEPILSFEITYNNTRFSLTKVLLSNIIEKANSYIHVNEAFLPKKPNQYATGKRFRIKKLFENP